MPNDNLVKTFITYIKMDIMNKFFTLIIISLLAGCVDSNSESTKESKITSYYINNYENDKIKVEYLCEGCELIDESLLSSLIKEQNNNLIELVYNPLTYVPKSLNGQCKQIQNAVHMDTEEELSNLYKLSLSIKYHAKTDMGVKKEGFFEEVYYIHNGRVNDSIFGKIKLDSIKFIDQEKEYINRNYEVFDPSNETSLTITPVLTSNSLLIQFGDKCIKAKSKIVFQFRNDTDIVAITNNEHSCVAIARIKLTSSLMRALGKNELAGIALIPQYGDDYIFTDTPDNHKDYFIQMISLIE